MSKKHRRIGLYGGSFDPVHMGHMLTAQKALDQFNLDKVIFIPNARPPHKETLATPDQRYAMLVMSIETGDKFEVSDCEMRATEKAYTIETLLHMKKMYPDASLFFIIGSDTLYELHSWKSICSVMHLCEFIVVERPGYSYPMKPEDIRLNSRYAKATCRNWIKNMPWDLSSSEIRKAIQDGIEVSYLIPHPVEKYIREHRLYGKQTA